MYYCRKGMRCSTCNVNNIVARATPFPEQYCSIFPSPVAIHRE